VQNRFALFRIEALEKLHYSYSTVTLFARFRG
jgi:hypothetical protein